MALTRERPAPPPKAPRKNTVRDDVLEDASLTVFPELSGPQVIGSRVRFLGVLMALAVGALLFSYARLEWTLAEATVTPSNLRGAIKLRDGTVMAESFEPRKGDATVSSTELLAGQVRRYPQGSLAGQVLGFKGRDKGLEGVEYFSEKTLGAGQDLTLTLDSTIQATAEATLEKEIIDQQADAGSVIALEAGTGRLLAVASYPRFNPERRERYDGTQWLNRPFRNQFEPGSTMKALVAGALINEGAVTPDTTVEAPMWRNVTGHIINDAIKHKEHLTLREVLRYSSNVGISKLAESRLSEKTLHDYLVEYGIGQPMTLEGSSPARGSLRDWQSWRPIDHATATFGQGESTTTLQLVTAFSVLTNDGLLIPPRLIENAKVQPSKRVLSAQAARTTRDMLRTAVEDGIPHLAAIPGYCVGGKTGTAQTAINGRYSSDVFGAIFAGFFPCDKPRVTMVVEIYNPKKQIHGSLVAAPVFKEIAEEVLAHWGIAPKDVPGKK